MVESVGEAGMLGREGKRCEDDSWVSGLSRWADTGAIYHVGRVETAHIWDREGNQESSCRQLSFRRPEDNPTSTPLSFSVVVEPHFPFPTASVSGWGVTHMASLPTAHSRA